MMPADLRITLIQSGLFWEEKEKNLVSFQNTIRRSCEGSDLIVLPEMFTTGFTMNATTLAEDMSGPTIGWLRDMAREMKCCITGSFIARDGDRHFNRLVWMRPEGDYTCYDKRHLFRMADEHHYYASGNRQLIITLNGWKICPLICYDLRFPVWSRNRYAGSARNQDALYDVLLYVANWPAARATAWNTLLRARAVENQAYCIGVNRTGRDGKNIEYNGFSAIVSPKGDYLLGPVENDNGVYSASLHYGELSEFRTKFPQGLDADAFDLKL